MSCLPQGHENLKSAKKYWKTSEMKEGDNKIRIVMRPIAGWIDWLDNKPLRFQTDQKPKEAVNPEKPIKAFWSLYVWDYAREDLFILEITQMGIINSLVALANDSDWGDFTGYDVKINKTGSLMKTKYVVTALPHKPLQKQVLEAIKQSPVRLEALYEGKDPWSDLDGFKQEIQAPSLFNDPIDELTEALAALGVERLDVLPKYLREESIDQPFSESDMAKNALKPGRLNDFVRAFGFWVQGYAS